MGILRSCFVLLFFQLAGEALRWAVRINISGPVLGMVLLAAWYLGRRRKPHEPLQQTADGLLNALSLFFVPAGVGIFANISLLRAAWLPIVVSLVGSTLLTLLTTAAIMDKFGRGAA